MQPGIKQILLGILLAVGFACNVAGLVIDTPLNFTVDGTNTNIHMNMTILNLTTETNGNITINEEFSFRVTPTSNRITVKVNTVQANLFYFTETGHDPLGGTIDATHLLRGMTASQNVSVRIIESPTISRGDTTTSDAEGVVNKLVDMIDAEYEIIFQISNVLDTGGTCLTPQGYSFSGTAKASTDWFLLNLTALDIVEDNLTNIQTTASMFQQAGNALIDTNLNKDFTIFIGGSDNSFTYDFDDTAKDQDAVVVLGNLTLENTFYSVKMRREDDAAVWNYDWGTDHVLTVLCDNFAPDTIDLDTLNQTTFFVAAKEVPKLEVSIDETYDRTMQPTTKSEDITFYNLNTTNTFNTVTFDIIDYVGDFTNSYLQIKRNVNASIETVWQEQWYDLQVPGVDLENNTFYQFVLFTADDTRIITWQKVLTNNDISIVIKTPLYVSKTNMYDGVELGFTSNFAASTVGVAWNVTSPAGDFINLSFTVSDFNNGSYINIHNQSVVGGGNSGAITFIVPDQNKSYPVSASMYTTGYTTRIDVTDLKTPSVTEEFPPFAGSLGVPNNILGLDRQDWYTAASIFIVSTVAMLFGFINVGVGGLVTVGTIGLLQWLGWMVGMTQELYIFLFAMAISYMIVERRRRQ